MSAENYQTLRDDGNHLVWLPKGTSAFLSSCPYQEFSSLLHGTHLSSVASIHDAGTLIPRQPSDSTTIEFGVVWLAGTPKKDERYGPVLLHFPLSLLEEKKYFLVELVDYWKSQAATRILVTDKNQDQLDKSIKDHAIPYDPTRRGGPWWQDGARHYALSWIPRRGSSGDVKLVPFSSFQRYFFFLSNPFVFLLRRNHTLEFVFDFPIPIEDLNLELMEHNTCKKNKEHCSELKICAAQSFMFLSKLSRRLLESVQIENIQILDGSFLVKELIGLAYLDSSVANTLLAKLCETEIVRKCRPKPGENQKGGKMMEEGGLIMVQRLVKTFVNSYCFRDSEEKVRRMLVKCDHFTQNDLDAIETAFNENHQITSSAKRLFYCSSKCPGSFLNNIKDDDKEILDLLERLLQNASRGNQFTREWLKLFDKMTP